MGVDFKELEKNIKGLKNFAEGLIDSQRSNLSEEERQKLDSHLKDINFEETLKNVDKSIIKMKKAINER